MVARKTIDVSLKEEINQMTRNEYSVAMYVCYYKKKKVYLNE